MKNINFKESSFVLSWHADKWKIFAIMSLTLIRKLVNTEVKWSDILQISATKPPYDIALGLSYWYILCFEDAKQKGYFYANYFKAR